jgi:hypothetical protein
VLFPPHAFCGALWEAIRTQSGKHVALQYAQAGRIDSARRPTNPTPVGM